MHCTVLQVNSALYYIAGNITLYCMALEVVSWQLREDLAAAEAAIVWLGFTVYSCKVYSVQCVVCHVKCRVHTVDCIVWRGSKG